jgi:hypothetical protein
LTKSPDESKRASIVTGMPGVALPDRVTVLTCIGCGAMGRQERCETACSEHKLVLVRAADHEEMLAAAATARARAALLAPIAREFADTEVGEPHEAFAALRERARRMLLETGPEPQRTDWAAPDTVTGWWCAECGNVDMPQPCIGVCVWRPADWVNVTVYERQLALAEPALRAARALRRFVARAAAVIPRDGQWERNQEALRVQADAALADHVPDAPAPESPPSRPPQPPPEPVVRVQLWPP